MIFRYTWTNVYILYISLPLLFINYYIFCRKLCVWWISDKVNLIHADHSCVSLNFDFMITAAAAATTKLEKKCFFHLHFKQKDFCFVFLCMNASFKKFSKSLQWEEMITMEKKHKFGSTDNSNDEFITVLANAKATGEIDIGKQLKNSINIGYILIPNTCHIQNIQSKDWFRFVGNSTNRMIMTNDHCMRNVKNLYMFFKFILYGVQHSNG